MATHVVEKDLAYALKENLRVISALVVRTAATRFGESRFGIVWTLAEPAAYVGVYIFLHAFVKEAVPFGDSALLFLLSGVFGFRMTRGIARKAEKGIAQNQPMLTYPLVRPLDTIVSAFILEAIIWLIICALFILFMAHVLDRKIIVFPMEFATCILAILYFAFSLALFNAVIGTLVPLWDTLFSMMSMPLMLISGVFFVPSQLPPDFQAVISWNPFLHCVEWFRSTTYLDYLTILDKGYLLAVSTGLLMTGLAAERIYRNRIMSE
ncbi:ABC transporter permease [Sinorhizobium sp. BG8]|uniref:ABC transporter permease n=1 Tax=Sinorhizobium sp. BG8 TaxID=2613773 RepID=UPI00193DF078|nr:ABC transporter permease [Sinorhizobium sp. BG8]QRM56522.1 hypothetical protein F3Y30_19775 [Sinorhizobium sp. BG8]